MVLKGLMSLHFKISHLLLRKEKYFISDLVTPFFITKQKDAWSKIVSMTIPILKIN
jgi:hypothetical protein